jgi:hypothetical protein
MSSRYFKITDPGSPGFKTKIVCSDSQGGIYERVGGAWKENSSGLIDYMMGDYHLTEITKEQAEAYQS